MSDGAVTQNSSLPALCAVLVVLATARRENSPTSCHFIGAYLMSVYLTGMHPTGMHPMGLHLVSMHLMGVHFIGLHFIGMCLISVYYGHASL